MGVVWSECPICVWMLGLNRSAIIAGIEDLNLGIKERRAHLSLKIDCGSFLANTTVCFSLKKSWRLSSLIIDLEVWNWLIFLLRLHNNASWFSICCGLLLLELLRGCIEGWKDVVLSYQRIWVCNSWWAINWLYWSRRRDFGFQILLWNLQ